VCSNNEELTFDSRGYPGEIFSRTGFLATFYEDDMLPTFHVLFDLLVLFGCALEEFQVQKYLMKKTVFTLFIKRKQKAGRTSLPTNSKKSGLAEFRMW
jgi:hypothetical protein